MPDPDDVGPGEQVPPADPLAVHVRAIHAHIHQHVSLGQRLDLGVAPGDVVAADHHVGAGVAAEDEWIGPYDILAPVGQADQPPAGGRRGPFGPGLPGWRHQVGECAAVEELGMTRAARVDGEDLMPADLDLVAVETGVGSAPSRTPLTSSSASGAAERMAAAPWGVPCNTA